MTKVNTTDIHNIYLFDYAKQDINPLKEFIYFLKFHHNKKWVDFCYSCEKDSLHQNLSIKENFILDAVPKSLIRDGEDNFKQFLKSLKNPHLRELVNELTDLTKTISELTPPQLKLASVLKSLLSQSEYIFFLNPDLNLDSKLISTVKKAMQFEVYQRFRKVIIKSENHDLWLDISGQIISKCTNSHQYHCQDNPLLIVPNDEPNLIYLNTEELKAA